MPAHAPMVSVSVGDLRPAWNDDASNMTVLLGDGFTPSGSLLRASLAMAASPLSEDQRNGGEGGMDLHNPYDGWGVFNLSQLVDPLSMANNTSPSADVWIHDSYRLTSSSVGAWFEAVSYTHLRAHETRSNLVCRLLLEKKKFKPVI